ncbi:MAG TPA: hypothetical protein VNF71_07815, partial [Acidimicrobiales bacterium]|nr:hypothetical protein [Acidimicrobiales bacterium]
NAEPTLERATIQAIVEAVAGGRAKRRRLAQFLLESPAVLADGCSPAPRVVGNLLIALRTAGALNISPPICATCGKSLRTLQRRDQDWYCAVCGARREPCTSCGHTRPVAGRDQQGRPHCVDCPPGDERDPLEVIAEVVCGVDPTVSIEVVISAVGAAVSNAGQRRRLAWTLQDRPELLSGAGAEAPMPSVLRLIDRLCDAGATHIVRPACPHCRRVVALVKPRNGLRLCRMCVARSRAERCVRCQVVREPATRDDNGAPICPSCLIRDPVNHEDCSRCGRLRPVSVRRPDGVFCETCRPPKVLTCSICGRHGPALMSETTGQPWCRACSQRWARCARCDQVRPLRGGTIDEPLCATCTRPDPRFWKACTSCGQAGRIHAGCCARCSVDRRLRQLLGDNSGTIRAQYQALYEALATTERPATVARWLDHSAAPTILRSLDADDGLCHEALDALPPGKPVEHLRAVLVAIGTLPARDEQMVRLERWITGIIAGRVDPDEQKLLHRYATWHVLRRLRHRLRHTTTTYNQALGARQRVRAAIALLDWMAGANLTLATAGQGDLEAWLASGDATHRRDVGNFVRWANKQKLTALDLPAVRWGGPSDIDTEARWEQARRLLHDDTLEVEDRFAGLLVLLYAQWPAAISRLTVADIETTDNSVRLRLGDEPIILPEPLAALALQLVATRKGHAVIGHQPGSPWLFPGGQPGRPVSDGRLGER